MYSVRTGTSTKSRSSGPHPNPKRPKKPARIEKQKSSSPKTGTAPHKGGERKWRGRLRSERYGVLQQQRHFSFFSLASLAIIWLQPFLGGPLAGHPPLQRSRHCTTVEHALPPTSQPEPFCGLLSCSTKRVPMHLDAAGNSRQAAWVFCHLHHLSSQCPVHGPQNVADQQAFKSPGPCASTEKYPSPPSPTPGCLQQRGTLSVRMRWRSVIGGL
ncbi:hypothetical protein B0T20DRAFT_61166 [Sordaria brevicollis]|uniref:Uncharacterized protein n=1 Tax=Sordaria brevicollis TaxID=83679 RepID=A0AAE0U6Q6_SORBR|nr:hypothetical protein B0T20DRAFT_61166 [Sordaria brevicollis]